MLSITRTPAPLACASRSTAEARSAGSGNGYMGKDENNSWASWSPATSAIRRWYR